MKRTQERVTKRQNQIKRKETDRHKDKKCTIKTGNEIDYSKHISARDTSRQPCTAVCRRALSPGCRTFPSGSWWGRGSTPPPGTHTKKKRMEIHDSRKQKIDKRERQKTAGTQQQAVKTKTKGSEDTGPRGLLYSSCPRNAAKKLCFAGVDLHITSIDAVLGPGKNQRLMAHTWLVRILPLFRDASSRGSRGSSLHHH